MDGNAGFMAAGVERDDGDAGVAGAPQSVTGDGGDPGRSGVDVRGGYRYPVVAEVSGDGAGERGSGYYVRRARTAVTARIVTGKLVRREKGRMPVTWPARQM